MTAKIVKRNLKYYWQLARHDRPIGTWLIFMPALMGLTLGAQDRGVGGYIPLFDIAIFFMGAFLIRGAGCTINDIWDRDFDGHVERTKTRILVKGHLTLTQAKVFLGFQLTLAATLLFFLRTEVFYLAFIAAIIMFTYPLFKRFTVLPQVYLGFCMNFSMLMAYVHMIGILSIDVLILYIGTVFWTIYYDTIYAHMDREDDLKAGVKSLALTKIGRNKWFLGLCVGGFVLSLILVLMRRYSHAVSFLNLFFGFLGLMALVIILFFQITKLNLKCPRVIYAKQCFKIFKANVYVGLMAWVILYIWD